MDEFPNVVAQAVDRRRLDRLETVTFEDHADCFHHVTGGGDLGRPAVGEAAG